MGSTSWSHRTGVDRTCPSSVACSKSRRSGAPTSGRTLTCTSTSRSTAGLSWCTSTMAGIRIIRKQPVGGVAYSVTDDLFGEWVYQNHTMAVYDTVIEEFDGSKQVFQRRERPKLLFGPDGSPQVLYTGVCPQDCQSCCYTHAQRINGSS